MSEPTIVQSSNPLPTTANGGAATPSFPGRGGAQSANAAGGTFGVKTGLAQMLKGGVIMDVMNVEQAKIAEEAGAVAVMALERIPANIRRDGGVARMAGGADGDRVDVALVFEVGRDAVRAPTLTSTLTLPCIAANAQSDPSMIKEIIEAVSIPVMAKCRIGHTVEAQILQAVGVDYIDESEVLTIADDQHHIGKKSFKVPFVCGCKNLGEALRRISEGAAMIRTKGEAGTGDVVEAVKHQRAVMADIRRASAMSDDELYSLAKELGAPYHLLKETARLKRLPVVSFAAGGVATPADAALMMQLGCDGVFVGSGIFMSGDPAKRARAIVQAVTHYNNPEMLAQVSENLGEAMVGISVKDEVKTGRQTSYADRGH